jgi:hypothetical protein
MKAFLMHRDRDFDLKQPPLPNAPALIQDLELNTLFEAMAGDDKFLADVVERALLASLTTPEDICYRQAVLKDCLNHPTVIRALYDIPLDSIKNKQRHWMGIFTHYPSAVLSSAIELLEMFVGLLRRLKLLADEHAAEFESEGFKRFFAMIQQELSDDYFNLVAEHLQELRFRGGVLLSAQLGAGNEGANHVLRRPNPNDANWFQRAFGKRPPVYTFTLHPRDESGARVVGELRDRGINLVANAVAQSADHIDSFINMLRTELAFYIGCLNLAEQLAQMGAATVFPVPAAASERKFTVTGLYDICLALTLKRRVVSNDVQADGKDLVIITGANQGGKSTFLRSAGLAHLLMQCGLFVPAQSACLSVCAQLFTHFKREEDASMESGKFDEELSRMSQIVNQISPGALILFNESFAATNEREGSEIARQVVTALLEKQIKVMFVTHLYEFAHGMCQAQRGCTLCLRAERLADGTRTFKLIDGEPLETSYGPDLYRKIFGEDTRGTKS